MSKQALTQSQVGGEITCHLQQIENLENRIKISTLYNVLNCPPQFKVLNKPNKNLDDLDESDEEVDEEDSPNRKVSKMLSIQQ